MTACFEQVFESTVREVIGFTFCSSVDQLSLSKPGLGHIFILLSVLFWKTLEADVQFGELKCLCPNLSAQVD